MKVKVSNLTSPRSWREVPNQFEIRIDGKRYFQSYDSVIAVIDENWKITLDERYWNYSMTTSKYRNQFLGLTTEETKRRIKSGEIALADLN